MKPEETHSFVSDPTEPAICGWCRQPERAEVHGARVPDLKVDFERVWLRSRLLHEVGERLSRPTIHVTNFASRNLHHGHVYTIMAKPRRWEYGEGRVYLLTPHEGDLEEVKAGRMPMRRYRESYMAKATGGLIGLDTFRLLPTPGHVPAMLHDGEFREVQDGDTLCCCCSKKVAARGECHRVWAAQLLHEAGWRVILDGRQFTGKEVPHGTASQA